MMRRPFPVFLLIGFLGGVVCLAAFLVATGRLSLNGSLSASHANLPPLAQDVTAIPQPVGAAGSNPDLPDPATFGPPNSDAQLPALTQGDPTRPPQPAANAAAPALPDATSFTPPVPAKPLPAPPQLAPHPDAGAKPVISPAQFPPVTDSDVRTLQSRNLIMPIAGLKVAQIQDTFNDTRGSGRRHEATDILSPRGTPIVAIDEGNVAKLFTSQRGGLTVYQFDNQGQYCYYYAHLDRYAEGLKEGMLLRKGDKVGYVGSTGDADAKVPHLHFAIFKLGPEKHYWQGTPINPYPVLMHILVK